MLNVQIINKSKHPLPAYATELSAGMDIRANLNEPISLVADSRGSFGRSLRIQLQLFDLDCIFPAAASEALHFRASDTHNNLIIDLQFLKRNLCNLLRGKVAIDHRNGRTVDQTLFT